LLLASLLSGAVGAQEIDVLNKAVEEYNDGKNEKAAIGFYQVEETATVEDNRFKAEYYLAQSLNKLGLGFGSFFYYGQIIKAGPAHPYYYKAVEGAVAVTDQYRDEVLGPNVLNKAYNDQFGRLPPSPRRFRLFENTRTCNENSRGENSHDATNVRVRQTLP